MSAAPLRIGVVGCGLIARRTHLPADAADERAGLIAVCSGRRETAEAAATEFGAHRQCRGTARAVSIDCRLLARGDRIGHSACRGGDADRLRRARRRKAER